MGRWIKAGIVVTAGFAVLILLAAFVWSRLATFGYVKPPTDPRVGGDIAAAKSDRAGFRVLFVGNRFTENNDMPDLVRYLADVDGPRRSLITVSYTGPEWSLRYFEQEGRLIDLIESVDWDIVVLQEQSQLPGKYTRGEKMYPPARDLHHTIENSGANTMLFMTWGHREGDPFIADDSFELMTNRLREGYEILGNELGAEVAPVGLAWAEAMRRDPTIDLWTAGGKYPSVIGSYLTACVFHQVLSEEDPGTSPFTGDLSPHQARFLQDVARDVVAGYSLSRVTSSSSLPLP
ncbi:MAG TPA: hypothetical protein VNP73_05310 [Actinomycetota bacterium]|nr:hypothetical protein [Actinomycetota bacterium]